MSKLGEVFIDRWGDEAFICVYDSVTKTRLDENDPSNILRNWRLDPEAILEHIEQYPEESAYLSEYGDIEDYDSMMDDRVLRSESAIKEGEDLHKRIKKALKGIEGLDLNNLILSNGVVYNGNDACCDYIQGTYAWCSSSMEC